jgi:hypothetical protein
VGGGAGEEAETGGFGAEVERVAGTVCVLEVRV